MYQAVFTAICLAYVGALATPAVAATQGDVVFDCAHFSKQPAGQWRGDGKATVVVGGSRIDLSNTVIAVDSMRIDGISMHARLERQCGAAAARERVAPLPADGQ